MGMNKKIAIALLCSILWACGEKTAEEYLTAAQQNINQQNYNAAIIELKNAIKVEPTNAKARFLLGKLYLHTKEYQGAEKELNRALEYNYSPSEVVPLLSKAYQKTGADNALIKLSHKQKGLTTAQATQVAFEKVAAFVRLNQPEKAKKIIDEVKRYKTNSPYKELILVYALVLDDNLAAAHIQLDDILSKYPAQGDALKLKANILLNQGKKEEALAVYRRYVELNTDDAEAAFILAHLLSNSGHSEEAEPIIDKLLTLNSENSLLNQLKALARFKAKDNEKALFYSEKALTKNPNDVALRVIAGVSAFLQQNYEKAQQHLSFIAEQLPTEHPALRLLAESQLKLGLTLEASDTIDKFEQLSSQDASLFSSVGLALVQQGELTKAQAVLQKSKNLSVADENSLNLAKIGLFKLSLNDISGLLNLESALAQVESAKTNKPIQKPIKQILATAYLSTKQLDKALALAQRWKKANSNDPEAYLLTGLVYIEQKEKLKAKREFEKLLAIEPNNSKAKMAIITLSQLNDQQIKQKLNEIITGDITYAPAWVQQYVLAKKAADQKAIADIILRLSKAVLTSNDSKLKLLLAKIYLNEKDYQPAIALLTDLKEQQKQAGQFWHLLGKAYIESKQFDKAKQLYQIWLAQQPNNKMAVFGNIAYLDSEGKHKQALALVNEYLTKKNNDVGMTILQVHLLLINNQFEQAEQAYNSLPNMVLRNPFVLGLQGQLQLYNKNYTAALSNLQAAYKALPNSRHARLVALTYYLLGEKTKGNDFLVRHLQQHPQDQRVLMQLANEQLHENTAQAIQNYLTAVKLNDNNAVAHNNLAYLYMQQGDLNTALEHAKKALALMPNNANVLDTLGQIYRQKQDNKTALNYLQKAVENSQADEEIYLNYIELLLINNELELAKRKISQREFKQQKFKAKLAQLQHDFGLSNN
jgi:putative PEP-CTERM system TPR-repeat lipoprotein